VHANIAAPRREVSSCAARSVNCFVEKRRFE
jgi:hypothetical protein